MVAEPDDDDDDDDDDSPKGVVKSMRGMLSSSFDESAGGIVNSQVQVNYKPTFVQGASADQTKDAKTSLLTAILGLDRGLAADDNAKRRVQKLACALEASNPTQRPLRSPLMNGEWELQYTTASAAVGGGGVLGLVDALVWELNRAIRTGLQTTASQTPGQRSGPGFGS